MFFQSPLNYTGGKFKLLPQILPHFPTNICTFVDLFCGGCNVGLNIDGETIIYNDINKELINLYKTLQKLDIEEVFERIFCIIETYELSHVSRFGYEYYGCNGSRGVGEYNRDQFLKLRDDFNRKKDCRDDDYYLMLYVIIVFSFNNQIRFNRYGDFNLPVGKRDFNKSMQAKLRFFMERIKEQNCVFQCSDFLAVDRQSLNSHDFVYADPPYLITCATYNEQGGWSVFDEEELLGYLDALDMKGVRFALSNVLRSKGKVNDVLLAWLEKNEGRYRAIHLNYTYANSNYQTKDKSSSSDEVLIVNYVES
ncbi:MAG: DNA adenine methylase [Planctomycetia bacterium]|nr:DNA adenine methylase [Planctomycetia bacterium]